MYLHAGFGSDSPDSLCQLPLENLTPNLVILELIPAGASRREEQLLFGDKFPQCTCYRGFEGAQHSLDPVDFSDNTFPISPVA